MIALIEGVDVDKYVVRKMCSSDISTIVEIDKECFSDVWSKEMWQDELQNSLTEYLVVLEDNKIIAFAGMWLIVGEAQITKVAVRKEKQGCGLGKFVTLKLVQAAWQAGAMGITLEVRKSNLPAQGAYKHIGFVVEGERKGYYLDNNEDALIMWLRFSEEECNHI